jgi:hypothetical protein
MKLVPVITDRSVIIELFYLLLCPCYRINNVMEILLIVGMSNITIQRWNRHWRAVGTNLRPAGPVWLFRPVPTLNWSAGLFVSAEIMNLHCLCHPLLDKIISYLRQTWNCFLSNPIRFYTERNPRFSWYPTVSAMFFSWNVPKIQKKQTNTRHFSPHIIFFFLSYLLHRTKRSFDCYVQGDV